MRARLVRGKREFKPVTIELTIETEQEAINMYQFFNMADSGAMEKFFKESGSIMVGPYKKKDFGKAYDIIKGLLIP